MRNPLTSKWFWKKIVYFSHKSVAVRMLCITFVAIYLFAFHVIKNIKKTEFKQRLAFVMCFLMIVSGILSDPIKAFAEEMENEVIDETVQQDDIEPPVVDEPIIIETFSEPDEPIESITPEDFESSESEVVVNPFTEPSIENQELDFTEPEKSEDEAIEEKDSLPEDFEEEVIGENLEDPREEIIVPELRLIEVVGGFYQAGTYYSKDAIKYSIQLDNESDVKIYVETIVNDVEAYEEIAFDEEGKAEWDISEEYGGSISFGYYDTEENFVECLSDEILLDKSLPNVTAVQDEKKQSKIDIVAFDMGDVSSGLNEVSLFVDGMMTDVTYEDEQSEDGFVRGTFELSAGEHTYSIYISDIAGNSTVLTNSVNVKKEVIQVVAPTLFSMKMLEFGDSNEIIGDNVAICNKSEKPVEIKINKIKVQVNRKDFEASKDKSCELYMQLSVAGQDVMIVSTPEGEILEVTSFVLEPMSENTSSKALFNELKNSDMALVESKSADYAVIRFMGSFNNASGVSWTDDDVKVHIDYSVNAIDE